jgi:hypothetical protein
MDFLLILIAWWLFSPFLKFFYDHPFLFFLLLYGGVWLYRRHRSKAALPEVPQSTSTNNLDTKLIDLLILRNELARQREAGTIDLAVYEKARQAINTLCNKSIADLYITPESQRWREGREAAWQLLVSQKLVTATPPPWQKTKQVETAQQLALPLQPRSMHRKAERTRQAAGSETATTAPQVPPASVVPPLPHESVALLKPAPEVSVAVDIPVLSAASTDEAWEPASPSALERALQTVSRWPALLVPFLAQNILWFICGLCFVAGSTFLVSSTSGKTNTLVVSGVLLAYSSFLLWIGYRLCHTRPELISGRVLLALGTFLIPLNIASTVRLISSAQTAPWLATGLLLTAVELVGFYYITSLVSGVMDRFLQGRHPQLFLALTAGQVAVPLLTDYPSWPLLALTHCALLGILAYGAQQFTREWLQSIFTERRKVAYYAIGTLVYAAVVSFVHLSWGHTAAIVLPAGYASPFLMAVCGLLFYVDGQLKQWTQQPAFLSRVNFFLYGLSIFALLLCIDAPSARILTLCVAIAVYGSVVWQYSTFTPLVILLACCGWLYQTVLLQPLEPQWHLLASLPGLVGLFATTRWLQQRWTTSLVTTCYWAWFGATLLICVWSLLHAHPSLVAMTTGATTMGLVFYGLQAGPTRPRETARELTFSDLRQSPWLYVVMLLGSVTVAYAPQSLLITWTEQTAIGLISLAGLWIMLGLRLYRTDSQTTIRQGEVLLNSALVNLALALALAATLAVPDFTLHQLLPLLLATIGSGLLWLSLVLRLRGLFYGALVLWGIAGMVLKWTYFPQPSTGTIKMVFTLAIWGVLWWLEHESEESLASRQAQLTARAAERAPLTLLGLFPVSSMLAYPTMLRLPLQQTMILLWAIGVWHLTARLLDSSSGWSWMCSASLGAAAALIGAGYFRLPLLVSVASILGLGACLVATSQFGFSQVSHLGFSGALYSLMVWTSSVLLLKHPLTRRMAYLLHLSGKPSTIETVAHWTAVASSLLCVVVPVTLIGLFTPSVGLFSTLVCVALFLSVAGWRYQNTGHSYLLLSIVTLAALLSYSWITLPLHLSAYTLLRDHNLGLLVSVIGLTLWAMAWEVSIQKTRLNAESIFRAERLYHDPLCHITLLLTVFTINQALALAWVDAFQGITVFATATLFLAAVALFAASSTLGHTSLQIAALLVVALATLWGESLLIHPQTRFTLWPGGSTFSDQWLTLSFVSGSLALLAHRLQQERRQQPYARPVAWAAALTYTWALLGTAALFVSGSLRADLGLSLTLLVLMASLFPLVQPMAEASIIRGFALPLLGSAFIVSTGPFVETADHFRLVALLWGFSLWAVANFILPRWNAQYPQWSVAPDSWPWFGLLSVLCCLLGSTFATSFPTRTMLLQHAGYLTASAAYLLLMLRNSSWVGFAWIAVFFLTRVGATILAACWTEPAFLTLSFSPLLLPLSPPIGELLWLNLLLLVIPWWRGHGETVASRLGWQKHNLPQPFLLLPAGFFALRLVHLVFLLCTNNLYSLFPVHEVQWLALFVFAGLLTFSLLHVWWWHRQTWEVHVLFASLSCTALITWLGYVSAIFHFPFFIALWSAAWYAAHALWEKYHWGGKTTEPLRRILSQWVEPTLVGAITALVLLPTPLTEQLLTLLVLIDTAIMLGWRRQQRLWLLVAGVMTLALLHDWPLLWVAFAQIPLLWPWYALQMALVSWLLLWISQKPQPTVAVATESEGHFVPEQQGALAGLWSWAWKITAGVAVIEWFLHAFSLLSVLAVGDAPQWLNERGDIAAALSAAGLLLGLGVRQAGRTQQAYWTYATVIFTGATLFYVRLVVVGLAPASAWDTTTLLTATYALSALYHFTRMEPLLHVVMVMPLLLFATIPLQLASPHASAAFMAASALYLLTYREIERSLPLYLALVTFNAALYLWIPVWAEHYNVIQLYVTPVAVSVLLLAHLHRHELKPQALSTIRLAAATTLYVSATSDVFLHEGLGIFLVALALSFAGILLGIAVRVRAFLYTGIASLICNLGWQLIMLFPEQRLSQAVILLTLAALLAGVMTWFNAQRESILQRVRIFRSDLETWA